MARFRRRVNLLEFMSHKSTTEGDREAGNERARCWRCTARLRTPLQTAIAFPVSTPAEAGAEAPSLVCFFRGPLFGERNVGGNAYDALQYSTR